MQLEIRELDTHLRMPGMTKLRAARSSPKARNDPQARSVSENHSEATQVLEFVTVTGAPNFNLETYKKIRTQVMRDYIRKQNRQAATGVIPDFTSAGPEEPTRYESKFKLDSWTHKTRTKAINARRLLELKSAVKSAANLAMQPQEIANPPVPGTELQISQNRQPNPIFILDRRQLDPFDSLSVKLGPRSERLLIHYHSSFSMNSVSVNSEGDFFSQARTDTAVLHSILYLVALHHDLKLGLSESPESLYHGSEAFKNINMRLQEGVFSDMTIAAVAMLATKENLDGRYEVSKIHMHGLEHMIRARGGIHKLKGVFQRVTTWSDFCYATVWNCQPRFPRISQPSQPITGIRPKPEASELSPDGIFGIKSPIAPIFDSLRVLSYELDPVNIPTLTRLELSNMIYETEFALLKLNKDEIDELYPTSFDSSFEAIPLKVAAHLYLYLVIREIPRTSPLLFRLAERLQEALGIQERGFWDSTGDERIWMLWMLFMGGAATAGRLERWWFVKEMSTVCSELGISNEAGLRDALKRVLWQEVWCSEHCMSLWRDLRELDYV